MRTLKQLADDLASSRATSRGLVESCLAAARNPNGEGRRVFLTLNESQALAAADDYDRLRANGRAPSPFAGIPISIKDLFDMTEEVTTAGTTWLRGSAPAKKDAVSVARLRAAGFVPIGRTNMTEFAFSGLGLNPHYGTPLNPFDRKAARIPGGSSSGAAVSVADGMCFAGLGTDTGGSCRIPAAMCGIVGFKPTQRRVPLAGTLPLSTSLDSIGPLANSAECCAIVDAVIAGETQPLPDPPELRGLRFAVPQNYVLDAMDDTVANAFDRALTALAKSGAQLDEIDVPAFDTLRDINRKGGIVTAEAYALHREWLDLHAAEYDPRVASRILRGKEQDAADYIDLLHARATFIETVGEIFIRYDAVLMPTVPIVAPILASLEKDDDYARINALALRNPSIVNFLDGCAISIPCHETGQAPVGLMLCGVGGADRSLLATAVAVERALAKSKND